MIRAILRWWRTQSAGSIASLNTIYIKAEHIIHNIHTIQQRHPHDTIFPVLKSNAYGHGLKQIAQIINTTNVPMIVVDSLPEYQIVRDYSSKDILLLGETAASNYRLLDLRRTHISVSTLQILYSLIHLKRKVRIHLFVNTGMNREGLQHDDFIKALDLIKQHQQIQLVGLMSHLSDADTIDTNSMQEQIAIFTQYYHIILDAGLTVRYRHIGASGAILKIHDHPIINARRPGLITYGYSPLQPQDPGYARGSQLKPALRITSTVTSVQHIGAGEGVSYNKTRKSEQPTTIATIPFGYYEGLPRATSNRLVFGRNNHQIHQRGNICMNLCSMETDEHPIHVGDTITLLDTIQHPQQLEDIAQSAGTIIYEILVKLSPSIKRVIERPG